MTIKISEKFALHGNDTPASISSAIGITPATLRIFPSSPRFCTSSSSPGRIWKQPPLHFRHRQAGNDMTRRQAGSIRSNSLSSLLSSSQSDPEKLYCTRKPYVRTKICIFVIPFRWNVKIETRHHAHLRPLCFSILWNSSSSCR